MPADPGILKRIRRGPFARGGIVRFRATGDTACTHAAQRCRWCACA